MQLITYSKVANVMSHYFNIIDKLIVNLPSIIMVVTIIIRKAMGFYFENTLHETYVYVLISRVITITKAAFIIIEVTIKMFEILN